jgi:hypothetical protein
MKKTMLILTFMLLAMTITAQDFPKFSPEKFDADMEAFVTKEAGLTQQEATKFFPLFREMHQKQRAVYGKMRNMGMQKPADEEGCAKAIKEADRLNLELRQIELTYHKKMLQVVSASKVFDAIKAESRFHRRMMRGWQHPPMGGLGPQQKGKRR